MSKYIVAYFSTLVAFLVLDGLWLGVIASGLYKEQIGQLMLQTPRIVPAAIFYLGYTVGVIVFAILPGLEAQAWQRTAMLGLLLGLMAYGTYDMTNLAILKDWPLKITLIDMAWGAVVTGLASTAGFFATSAWISRQA